MLPEVVEPVLPPDGDPPPAHAVTARVAQNPATTVDARRRLRRLAGDLIMCLPFCPSRGLQARRAVGDGRSAPPAVPGLAGWPVRRSRCRGDLMPSDRRHTQQETRASLRGRQTRRPRAGGLGSNSPKDSEIFEAANASLAASRPPA